MGGIAVLIPAAGFGTRMRGADKLTQLVEDQPLLRRQAKMALSVADHVTVTLPDYTHPRAQALAGLPVQIVAVPDADQGMSSSLRRAIAHLPRNMQAAMILPADMPELTAQDLQRIIDGFHATIYPMLQQGTTADGAPGHPVLFPADCFNAIAQLTGDQGARDVVKANQHRVRRVPLPAEHAVTDLDTPEAWTAWRALNPA